MDGQPLSDTKAAGAHALTLDNVSVVLGGRRVVEGVSTVFTPGELVTLLGPNGVGKTTLLRAAAGLIRYSGQICLGNHPVDSMTPRERAQRIGYLAQTPTIHWPMAVFDIVALGRLPHRSSVMYLNETDQIAINRAIAAAELQDFVDRRVNELSAGERARVLLARTLAGRSEILLADEPNAALDPYHQLHVMELLRNEAQRGVAVISVLHDLRLAAQFADRVLLMDNGVIVASGSPEDVLTPSRIAETYGIHRGSGTETSELLGPKWERTQPAAK